jgi:hypothetical protein
VAGDVGASGVAGVLDLLCNRTITVNQKVRQGERREMVQKRGRRVLHCTGIRRRFACSSEDSGEKFATAWRRFQREKERVMVEEVQGLL